MPKSNRAYRPRIYVSSPLPKHLNPARAGLRRELIKTLKTKRLAPQEFGISGMPQSWAWNFARSAELMRHCDGAVILALARYMVPTNSGPIPMPTEYNHFEGAVAISQSVPTLVIAEDGMNMKGILFEGGGLFILKVPAQLPPGSLTAAKLRQEPVFKDWLKAVTADRFDLFLGYCSKADVLASNIRKYLEKRGFSVLDWSEHFRTGRTIMEEIERAASVCRCGVFLFTPDDPIEGSPTAKNVPRDNVLLEAGYFTRARGKERVAIVREAGTKMPVDLGGVIYLSLTRRADWQSVAKQLHHFLSENLKDHK